MKVFDSQQPRDRQGRLTCKLVDDAIQTGEPSAESTARRARTTTSSITDSPTPSARDELPEVVRDRLLHDGFVRMDADGLFAADRYVAARARSQRRRCRRQRSCSMSSKDELDRSATETVASGHSGPARLERELTVHGRARQRVGVDEADVRFAVGRVLLSTGSCSSEKTMVSGMIAQTLKATQVSVSNMRHTTSLATARTKKNSPSAGSGPASPAA